MSYSEKNLFKTDVLEVVRTLPAEQAAEIRRYGLMLDEEATRLEYGSFYAPSDRYATNERHRNKLPAIISQFAIDSFGIAERQDFPGLSPGRALKITRLADQSKQEMELVITQRTFSAPEADALKTSSIGIVGLQAAILGDAEQLLSANATEVRRATTTAFAQSFISPIYSRWLAYSSSKSRY